MTRAVAFAIAMAATGCSLPDGEYFGEVPSLEGRDPRHLRWCNSGEPETMDPALASTTTALKPVYVLFDGLYVYDANGLPEPSLATSTDQTPDLRRFTFHMRTEGKWTNGRPITAHDFAYHLQRVLHPTTASTNGDALFPIKNAEPFLGNRIRVVMNDVAGLPTGTIVEVVGVGGKTGDEAVAGAPDPNVRTSTKTLALRDLGAAETAAYRKVPPGTQVQLLEISGRPGAMTSPADFWAYVFWNTGEGVFGWVPVGELDGNPNAAVQYMVKPVAMRNRPGVDATSEELTADDAVERRAVTAPGASLLMLPEALGIRVPDPYTLVLETSAPTPYMLNLANQRAMRASPREAVARSPRRWAEPGTFVGSGGMKLVEWKERDYMEMVRSETFWNQSVVKLDRLTIFDIADQAAITNYYFTGGCDATTSNPVPATYMPVMTGEKRGGKPYKDFVVAPWNATYYPLVNAQKFPNRHFRRALSYALDRKPVVQILKAGQIPSAQLSPGRRISDLSDAELAVCGVTKDTPGLAMIMITNELCYVPPPGLDFDPAKAKEEMELARKEMGDKLPTTVTYRYNLGSEAHKLIAELIQASWQRTLGITVKLEAQEWKTMVSDATAGNYETMRFGAVGNFPDSEAEFLPPFKCNSPDNRPHWCNKEFDAALEAAMKISDRKERLKYVYAAEKLVVEDAAVIPLYTYTQQFLIRPYVRDLPVNLVDQMQIERAWIDPDWRKHQQEARPVTRLIITRLLGGLVVVLVSASIAFLLLKAAPGGPFDDDRKMSKDAKRNIEEHYHLRDPLFDQYTAWMSGVVRLDFGPTMKRRQSVNELIGDQYSYSLKLGVFAMSFALLFGVTIGVIAASKRNTRVDYGLMGLALFGISIPSIVLGPVLQNWFALKLGWFPIIRAESFSSYVLPGCTLGLIYTGTIARLARGGMLEVLNQDYIRTARAKGLSERQVVWKHGVRLGLMPVITYIGPATAALIAGSFVVEKIYQIPGLGAYFIDSVADRDYTLLGGLMVFYVSIVVVLNLAVDIAYRFLDPRIRGLAMNPEIQGRSLWHDAWRRLRRNKMAVVCGFIVLFVVLFCAFGPLIAGAFGLDGTTIDTMKGATPPSGSHWFGTDVLGRDMLVRVMEGGRIALIVAITATLVAVVIGVSYGATAGYVGGRTDFVMMRFVDVLYGFPTIVFIIVMQATLLQNHKDKLIVLYMLIGAISWLTMARIVRGQVMSLRHREFVDAARVIGATPSRILFRHIVPNVLGPVIVYATLSVPFVMLTEAFLSFIGLGVQAPKASWGTLVTEGSSQIVVYPWLLYAPGLVMGITIFALNFFGDGLRDALDPSTRKD